MKHIVFGTAKNGLNVVVSNHRGLGGVSITVSTKDGRSQQNKQKNDFSIALNFSSICFYYVKVIACFNLDMGIFHLWKIHHCTFALNHCIPTDINS